MHAQNQAAENKNSGNNYWSTPKQITFGIIIVSSTVIALFGNLFV